jgi:hypothetical protein
MCLCKEVCLTDLCSDASELDIANHVLQKAAEYVGRLTDKNCTLSDLEEARDIKGLEAEYFILRTALVSFPDGSLYQRPANLCPVLEAEPT